MLAATLKGLLGRRARLTLTDPTLAAGYTLRQGRPPAHDDEAVLDQATATAGGWRLGDTLGILGADGALHRFLVVGITGFAGAQSPPSELDTLTPRPWRCCSSPPRSACWAAATPWTRSGCAPRPG